MKLFTSVQIADIDRYTIEHEPILSVNLMERAVRQLFDWFKNRFEPTKHVYVFAGSGNNGGDGLALARMLILDGWNVTVLLVQQSGAMSSDARLNYDRLKVHPKSKIIDFGLSADSFIIEDDGVVVDAVFGSGLNRPCSGLALAAVKMINASHATVVSIDIPTGLMGEDNRMADGEGIVKADYTLTFQFPKMAFLFAENERFVGQWIVMDIGLHRQAIEQTPTHFFYLEAKDVACLLKKRSLHCHKGDFGHALLCAGSYGMIGAAVLAGRACLRAGAGLLTVHLPQCGYMVMQAALPEAIVSPDENNYTLSALPEINKYNAIAIGPGIGFDAMADSFLDQLIQSASGKPLILDADALNILARHPQWWERVAKGSIITPHPGEFDRLTQHHIDGYSRMVDAIHFAREHQLVVVLKGAHSLVVCPSGNCYANSTGNPGMATAGSGDVLTGILLGLLSQGYDTEQAAIVGVFLHGLAADMALDAQSMESLISSDISNYLGQAYLQIRTFVGSN